MLSKVVRTVCTDTILCGKWCEAVAVDYVSGLLSASSFGTVTGDEGGLTTRLHQMFSDTVCM